VLVALLGYGGAEGRVAVHGGCGAYDHVGPLALVGGALRDVVQAPRAHGYGYGLVLPQRLFELLDALVLGVQGGAGGEEVGLDQPAPGCLEALLDLLSGDRPGVLVGDDGRRALAEALLEHFRDRGQGPLRHDDAPGVRRLPERRLDPALTHELPPLPRDLPDTY
jgi:hypothetical protein